MKITYDKKADALYIAFQNGNAKVAETIPLKDFFIVDLDKKGQLYGIEILDASSRVPVKNLITVGKKQSKSKLKKKK